MRPRSNPRRSRGQVIVEMLLTLPIFLLIVFTILEMGNIAFHLIIIQHATWETARFGAMLSGAKGGRGPINIKTGEMDKFLKGIIKKGAKVVNATADPTTYDPQAEYMANDLVLTTEYDIPLIFTPVTGLVLSKPLGTGYRRTQITLRMPIEVPLIK